MKKQEQPEQEVYFTIRRKGNTWDVEGQLSTRDMKDVLDLIMILLTNAVRLGITVSDLSRSTKPMEKALTSQLKDIIKAEVREARDAKASQSAAQENAADNSQEAR